MVDPRKAGLATKTDHWLRVLPGTDAALALSLTHVMIENGWYDADFVRDWTNGSLDVPGGNVLFEAVPSNPIDGMEFLSDARAPRAARPARTCRSCST